MTTKTSYEQGTPCWVDLQTPDQDAARAFYAGVFGWQYQDQPMPEGPVYSMAQLDGRNAAAIAPQNPDQAAAGIPAMWNTYLAVDDVDAVTSRVAEAGGTVAMEPFDVMDAGRMSLVKELGGSLLVEPMDMPVGRMAVARDPQGAVFNLMQPAEQPRS